jgi:hypothetical protein
MQRFFNDCIVKVTEGFSFYLSVIKDLMSLHRKVFRTGPDDISYSISDANNEVSYSIC